MSFEKTDSEEVIKDSREWYRALAEDVPVLVTRVSAEGLITYVNEASRAIINKKRDEIIGRDFFQTVPQRYRSRVKKAFFALTPENPEVIFEHRNRSRWFRWKNRAIFDAKGRLSEFFTVGEDITDQREMAKKLKESEAHSRALIEALPDMLFIYSFDGRYIDARVKDDAHLHEQARSFCRKRTLIGKNISDVLPASIAESLQNGIDKAVHSGKTQFIEYCYSVDGFENHFEARLVAVGSEKVLSIVRNITERREVEKALHYQLGFEIMMADISAKFVGLPSGKIDEAVNYALKLSGEFFEAERIFVGMLREEGRFLDTTHEWRKKEIASTKLNDSPFPMEKTPWWSEQLRAGEQVYMPDIEILPPEAEKDKVYFRAAGLSSFLTIPMVGESKVIGAFGFEVTDQKKPLSEREIAPLKLVAGIIAGAIIKHETEKALKASEERYREILNTMEEGYYEVDLSGTVTYCNAAACRLYGYEPGELNGINYSSLYADPKRAFKTFRRVFLEGSTARGLILEMKRKDGLLGYGEISITPVKDEEGYITGFKGMGRDVTERIRYEQRLEYLSMHDQLMDIYNRAYFETELNRLEQGREYPVTIISADLDGLKLVNDTMGHDAGDGLLKDCAEVLKGALRRSDVLARVGGDEFSAILSRTDRKTGEAIMRRIRENVEAYNLAHAALPLGISIGTATAENKDISLKDLFKRADDMMYRDKLYRSSSSRGKIVQSLLAALAERDYITEGHARRLEALCRAMGERIALSSHQLADLALLAQVHDLGKVGIPDHILFKPGPLTEEEWDIMRGHPEKGYRIASSSPDLSGVADLILKHHERWDGGGYPMGLKEQEIPVECRILAIVDAFDAMTNQRPYNRTKSSEEALVEIKEHAGRQFDPNLVPIFIAIIDEQEPV